jgi:hypothetical protein
MHLSTECYKKVVNPQCADVIAIHKIAPIEDNCLKTDVHSVRSGMDATDRHEAL